MARCLRCHKLVLGSDYNNDGVLRDKCSMIQKQVQGWMRGGGLPLSGKIYLFGGDEQQVVQALSTKLDVFVNKKMTASKQEAVRISSDNAVKIWVFKCDGKYLAVKLCKEPHGDDETYSVSYVDGTAELLWGKL